VVYGGNYDVDVLYVDDDDVSQSECEKMDDVITTWRNMRMTNAGDPR